MEFLLVITRTVFRSDRICSNQQKQTKSLLSSLYNKKLRNMHFMNYLKLEHGINAYSVIFKHQIEEII